MKIEHVAFDVKAPVEMAEWYVKHLGMKVIVKGGPPVYGHFLADATGRTLLEIYDNPAVTPLDFAALDALLVHVAFAVDDVQAERQRLLKAGATDDGAFIRTPGGDVIAPMRDPWGLAIQLAQRKTPMP